LLFVKFLNKFAEAWSWAMGHIINNIKQNPMKHFYRLLYIMAALVSSSAFAQTATLTGTVTDSAGVPVIGASVIDTADKSTGAITDIDGRFSMEVPSSA